MGQRRPPCRLLFGQLRAADQAAPFRWGLVAPGVVLVPGATCSLVLDVVGVELVAVSCLGFRCGALDGGGVRDDLLHV